MEHLINNILGEQFTSCDLITPPLFSATFFFTNDETFYIQAKKSAPTLASFYVDDTDATSRESLCIALKNFLSRLGKNILFAYKEQPLDQSTWLSAAKFNYQLLEILQWFAGRLLLVSSSDNMAASLFHGSSLSLTQEAPTFQYCHLEIDNSFWQNVPIYFETCFAYGYSQFKLQQDKLFYAQWSSVTLEPKHPPPLHGNVIITGGNGALGQVLARYLKNEFGCRVFLTGRRELNPALSKQLKITGAKAYIKVDCSNYVAMQEIATYLEKTYGKITGIFHLAGVINDGLLRTKNIATYVKTLTPKVGGALVVEQLSKDFKLDWVVLFSSLSGIIGNIGQTDYAAANAFLNAIVRHNNKTNTLSKWYAINWGLWQSQSGMQMENTTLLEAMLPQKALASMCQIFAHQLEIATIYQGAYSLVHRTSKETSLTLGTPYDSKSLSLLSVETWVHEIIVKCTKLRDLKNQDYLLEKGVDSIIAINIAVRISQSLSNSKNQINITKTLVFQYGTISAIAQFLIENYSSALNDVLIPIKPTDPFISIISKEENNLRYLPLEKLSSDDAEREEDIAIIGMAGEFPKADDIIELWQLLKEGKSAIQEIPSSRWNWRNYFTNDSRKPSYARHGGFITHAEMFDAQFFKTLPIEAEKMDPQARRLLHQSYLALGDGDFFSNSTSNVGVFIAAMYGHYQSLESQQGLINSSFASIANHLSHYFDFKGPSVSVDTMCSGSLSALHLGINSLRLKECQIALVGGVNIMCNPGKFRFLSEGKFLSPTGRCHSFGIGADGYVPGEGVVALVIKPLRQALVDEDKIYGVIKGSALNAVGRASAFTVPSAKAQASVISKALEQANISPDKISYIEAHSTGTSLGDPIEIEGLNIAYGTDTQTPCRLGSLKSNIGHLESAAGLASIVKVILQMHYRTLVPSLFCSIENPQLPLKNSRLKVQKELCEWKTEQHCLYAGISAFGAGGSNAHIILKTPPSSHQRKKLAKPNKIFNQQAYWAKGIFDETDHVTIREDININPLLLTPNRSECHSPLALEQDMPKIYLCLVGQEGTIETLLNDTHHHYIVLDENNEWRKALQSRIAAIDSLNVFIVNLCAYETQPDIKQFFKLHFEFAKLVYSLNQTLYYQHCTPYSNNTELARIKSLSALFQVIALEKSNFHILLVESDSLLADLIKKTQGKFKKKDISYQHCILSENRWYEHQYTETHVIDTHQQVSLLKKGGIYLLAGGLGAIGMLISEMLLKNYQATVIIIGRSTLTAHKQELFEQLIKPQGKLEYYVTDITKLEKVEQCIINILQSHGRLDGVIQSTSVLNDNLFNKKSFLDFNAVIGSKIDGTINLDEATKNLALDFFICFSSVSSVFGNVGQADYCVANNFLDLFSNYRSQQVNAGLRSGTSISINWPFWQVEGLAIDQATVDYIIETTGLRPLKKEEGVHLFDSLLDKKTPSQIIPLLGDHQKIKDSLIYKSVTSSTPHNSKLDKENLLENLKKIIAKITKISVENLDFQIQISDLGFNSLLLAEMASEIKNCFDIVMAPSAFFTYNSLEKITDYIFKKTDSAIKPINLKHKPITSTQHIYAESENDFAIIGLDGLLPGGPDITNFWQSLLDNQSAVRKVERWKKNYYAATLPDIQGFDAKFFGISKREAKLMDPQHRLFLQTAYNTLLNAAYAPSQLRHVGVFVGVQFNDYQGLLQQQQSSNHAYAATGNAHAMLANRVSYLFNFDGPSQTIDTACSSTLVAINRGLIALKSGECEAVLAGAVSLLIDPIVTDAATSMGILSPQYRCATFDEAADGYVRGEGVGCFLIKRLKDAKKANDPIHAIIKSFAENHGGKANSLTAPKPLAQKQLLLKAYSQSLARQVSYIETHGTGTKLGDPVEIDALVQAFAILNPDAEKGSIQLGAVKTNIGHLEPAAGIPALMKVIYALKTKKLPANIHFKQQNPYIQLENTPFELLTENKSWQSKHPLVAGISSFGFGGSNAHLVLMRYEATPASHQLTENRRYLFTLSAASEHSFAKMRLQLAIFLKKEGCSHSLLSISFTLNTAREHFGHRMAVVSDNLNDFIEALTNSNYSNIVNTKLKPNDFSSQMNVDDAMQAYLQGKQLDWSKLYGNTSIKKLHLPGYCFDLKPYWFDEEISVASNGIAELTENI
jgi:acyl transferase domain-containing protein/NAD(P)-dependent dehydrogenase (short-subunit alcohol dehydrogenase family)/acyl carrier protein